MANEGGSPNRFTKHIGGKQGCGGIFKGRNDEKKGEERFYCHFPDQPKHGPRPLLQFHGQVGANDLDIEVHGYMGT